MRVDVDVDITVVRVANTSRPDHIVFKNSRPCAACRDSLLRSGVRVRNVGWSTERDTIVVAARQGI